MSRTISEPLWRLLKPDDKKFSPFSPDSGASYLFDDFFENGEYVTKDDESECGWIPFSGGEGLVLKSNLNVTESTRIVVEGRFRPVDRPVRLLMGLNNALDFWTLWLVHEPVKLGFFIEKTQYVESVNGSVDTVKHPYFGPHHACKVRCMALGGEELECDWLACAEVQI